MGNPSYGAQEPLSLEDMQSCHICGRWFASKATLVRHTAEQHPLSAAAHNQLGHGSRTRASSTYTKPLYYYRQPFKGAGAPHARTCALPFSQELSMAKTDMEEATEELHLMEKYMKMYENPKEEPMAEVERPPKFQSNGTKAGKGKGFDSASKKGTPSGGLFWGRQQKSGGEPACPAGTNQAAQPTRPQTGGSAHNHAPTCCILFASMQGAIAITMLLHQTGQAWRQFMQEKREGFKSPLRAVLLQKWFVTLQAVGPGPGSDHGHPAIPVHEMECAKDRAGADPRNSSGQARHRQGCSRSSGSGSHSSSAIPCPEDPATTGGFRGVSDPDAARSAGGQRKPCQPGQPCRPWRATLR